MVIVLTSRSRSAGSCPAWAHCVVFWGKSLTLTVPLSTQVYKWVQAYSMLGGNPVMD